MIRIPSKKRLWIALVIAVALARTREASASTPPSAAPIQPRVITEPTKHDTDDPAIWINRANPAQSLIVGTDKNADGALMVFGLDGKIQWDKCVRGLLRPNNVDIAYDVSISGKKVDIAVTTERYANRLRVYRLPEMAAIDGGGIPVFEGEAARECMGVALYTRERDGTLFAIVGRSDAGAPRTGYLAQYQITDDGKGVLRGRKVRNFGTWSGRKEIEAIAVDNELGYVYYSDETFGVRKYQADPDAPNADRELAVIGASGFAEDHEGISIYKRDRTTGYIVVSDQQANQLQIFTREGAAGHPHEHLHLRNVRVAAIESDGHDVTSTPLGAEFPRGMLVAMSNEKTFHLYSWNDLFAGSPTGAPIDAPRR